MYTKILRRYQHWKGIDKNVFGGPVHPRGPDDEKCFDNLPMCRCFHNRTQLLKIGAQYVLLEINSKFFWICKNILMKFRAWYPRCWSGFTVILPKFLKFSCPLKVLLADFSMYVWKKCEAESMDFHIGWMGKLNKTLGYWSFGIPTSILKSCEARQYYRNSFGASCRSSMSGLTC